MEKKSAEAYLDRLLNSVNGKEDEDVTSEVREVTERQVEEKLEEVVEDMVEDDDFFKTLLEEADDIEVEMREDKSKREKTKAKRQHSDMLRAPMWVVKRPQTSKNLKKS